MEYGQMNKMKDQPREAVRQGLDNVTSAAGSAVRAVGDQVASALDTAKTQYSRFQDQAVAGAKATDRVIRENPYWLIGVALCIGLFFGAWFRRD